VMVAVINRRQNRKIVRVRTHIVLPLNLRIPLSDTQQLNPHSHPRRRITLTSPPNILLAGLTQRTQGHLTKTFESVVLRRVKNQKITVKSIWTRTFRYLSFVPSSPVKSRNVP
jgi:hypothetical protein